MLRILFFSIIFLYTTGCSHQTGAFQSQLDQRRCDEALTSVPENQTTYKISAMTEQASGTLISYTFIGAAYTAQILWNATVGLASAIVLCSPGIILNANSKTQPTPETSRGPTCLSADTKDLKAPPLGAKAIEQTQALRCPNLSGLSKSIRKVASCYAAEGTPQSIHKGLALMQNLKNSGSFYTCLDEQEIKALESDLIQLELRLIND